MTHSEDRRAAAEKHKAALRDLSDADVDHVVFAVLRSRAAARSDTPSAAIIASDAFRPLLDRVSQDPALGHDFAVRETIHSTAVRRTVAALRRLEKRGEAQRWTRRTFIGWSLPEEHPAAVEARERRKVERAAEMDAHSKRVAEEAAARRLSDAAPALLAALRRHVAMFERVSKGVHWGSACLSGAVIAEMNEASLQAGAVLRDFPLPTPEVTP